MTTEKFQKIRAKFLSVLPPRNFKNSGQKSPSDHAMILGMEIGAEIAIGIAAGMMMGYAGIYLMRGMFGELASQKKNIKLEPEKRVDRRGRLKQDINILDADVLEEAGAEKI